MMETSRVTHLLRGPQHVITMADEQIAVCDRLEGDDIGQANAVLPNSGLGHHVERQLLEGLLGTVSRDRHERRSYPKDELRVQAAIDLETSFRVECTDL
jgi:hypothetical protein